MKRCVSDAMLLQQLALGLIIPSLELTRWRTRQPHTSIPVVYTTLKMVRRRRSSELAAANAAAAAADYDDDDNEDDNVTSEWHHVKRTSHETFSSR